MTTTPETPALPGDLADETTERATDGHRLTVFNGIEEEIGEGVLVSDLPTIFQKLAAARVAPVEQSEEDSKCSCDGPPHRYDPNWCGQKPRRAAREDDLQKSIDDLREEMSIAMRERDAALELMNQHRCGDAAERAMERAVRAEAGLPAPSPDREKLSIRYCLEHGDLLTPGNDGADVRSARCRESHSLAALAALSVPPVVNEAKLEQALLEALRDNAMMFENGAEEWIAESDPVECLPALARGIVERQREWLGDGR